MNSSNASRIHTFLYFVLIHLELKRYMYTPVVSSKTIPDSRPKWAKCFQTKKAQKSYPLGWHHMYQKRLACIAYQAFHNLAPDDINNLFTKHRTPYSLRGNLRLELVFCKFKVLHDYFNPHASIVWNCLPQAQLLLLFIEFNPQRPKCGGICPHLWWCEGVLHKLSNRGYLRRNKFTYLLQMNEVW